MIHRSVVYINAADMFLSVAKKGFPLPVEVEKSYLTTVELSPSRDFLQDLFNFFSEL